VICEEGNEENLERTQGQNGKRDKRMAIEIFSDFVVGDPNLFLPLLVSSSSSHYMIAPSLSEHGEEENLAVCYAFLPALAFIHFFLVLHYLLFREGKLIITSKDFNTTTVVFAFY